MVSEGGPAAVFLLLGSGFLMVASAIATIFPPLAFTTSLWIPFQFVPSSYYVAVPCTWSLTVLSFYITDRMQRSDGEERQFLPLLPAVLSAFLFYPIATSIAGIIGLSGAAFCGFSFAVSMARY